MRHFTPENGSRRNDLLPPQRPSAKNLPRRRPTHMRGAAR